MTDEKDIEPDEIDDESRSLFRQAVSGSRRLKDDRAKPYRPRVKPVPRQRHRDEKAVLDESLAPLSLQHIIDSDIESDDYLSFAQPGVQQSVMKKLRRGQYRIEAELDLHRMTSEQALNALRDFISQCQRQHIRCVRIIHGKGLGSENKLPVLKARVNSWLRQWNAILAFCSARPCDGGNGAIYALLKRL
ncbi:MAG: Smr/MutS family protein [Thioalkalispiraceae bacterium]|jgi:DNA-nicking Smr family endonuclease